jgi:hypothetical protein
MSDVGRRADNNHGIVGICAQTHNINSVLPELRAFATKLFRFDMCLLLMGTGY